jgi:hypothetical protein
VLNYALGGWQTSGIVTLQSGQPFTVTAGTDRSRTALGSDRGVLVGQPYGPGACRNEAPCHNYLNVSAFALPDLGSFGNIGKNSLRGPGFFNWDFGLAKTFKINERLALQFRGEFFNLSNHVNFGQPSDGVSSGTFGRILSTASAARIGQLGLKIQF